MNIKLYWKNQIPLLLTHLIGMLALAIFLLMNKNSLDSVILIVLIWSSILIIGMAISYFNRKNQMETLLQMTKQLEQRYLIAELIKMPSRADDQIFYQILKMAEKSMLEQIGILQCDCIDYKEYIEQWVHEIKTPVTAMKLLCENNHCSFTRELLLELEKINHFTEQALYYTRSEHTEKDYFIQKIRLFDVVHQAIADNKYFLLQNNITIDVKDSDDIIYSDDKWICFILNQLIVNAVKYRSENPSLQFYSEQENDQVLLFVKDNGIGISSADLPRIFEKGFTGHNGRVRQNSTGIGLYLCKRLCDKLGIKINVHSNGNGTTMILSFYKNHLLYQVQS